MTYHTIGSDSVAEIETKKSRFIAWVCPASKQAEAEDILSQARTNWPGATHYCYAWILRETKSERCSDAGEPSGTAGLPILTVLKNHRLENVVAVVVRYYGGILLGSSGLIRAYSDSVRRALDNAEIIHYQPGCKVRITIDYSNLGQVQHWLELTPNLLIESIEYTDKVIIGISLPLPGYHEMETRIEEMTAGKGIIDVVGECMIRT